MKAQCFTFFASRLEASEEVAQLRKDLAYDWDKALVQNEDGTLTGYSSIEKIPGKSVWSALETGHTQGLKFITPGQYTWEEAERLFGLGFLKSNVKY